MDTDLIFFLGLLVGLMSIPRGIAQLSENYIPVGGLAGLIFGVALVLFAIGLAPDRYSIAAIPDLFFDMIGRYRFW